MSRRRTERLVNLVFCLLSSRRYLTAAQIAGIVPGYEHEESDPKAHEAFQRMFERDKGELRDLGVPLETGTNSVFDTEPGYRVSRNDYALPELHLDPEEATAVGIAARLWHHTELSTSASSGLVKLRAAGVDLGDGPPLGIEPVVSADPALTPMISAITARRAVRFAYRTPRDGEARTRRLQPWGVVSWRGRWYVVGHDLDRGATRCFRLSRVAGTVTATGPEGAFEPPEGVDLVAQVAEFDPEPPQQRVAKVRVRVGAAAGLRRWADSVEPDRPDPLEHLPDRPELLDATPPPPHIVPAGTTDAAYGGSRTNDTTLPNVDHGDVEHGDVEHGDVEQNHNDHGDVEQQADVGQVGTVPDTDECDEDGESLAQKTAWDIVTLTYSDPEALAARLAGYGSVAVVLEPPDVRRAVIGHLTRIAGLRTGTSASMASRSGG